MTGLDLLLDPDREFLERMGWEVDVSRIAPQNEIQIIVRKFLFPPKYSPSEADLLVRQPSGYPMAPMDMFWTRPDVVLVATGVKPQAADQYEEYQGLRWQRWSRHTTWRPNIDMLENFMGSILTELRRP